MSHVSRTDLREIPTPSCRAESASPSKNDSLDDLNELGIVYTAAKREGKVCKHDIVSPRCLQRTGSQLPVLEQRGSSRAGSSANCFQDNVLPGPDLAYHVHAAQSDGYLKEVSDFARSLTSRSSNIHHTRTSEIELWRSIVRWNDNTSFIAVFLRAHATIFSGQPVGKLKILLSSFSSRDLLATYIQHVGTAFEMDGIYIATINIATLLEHGELKKGTERSTFSTSYHVRWLFTEVMVIILRTSGPNVFSFMHVTLTFLLRCARIPELSRAVELLVPWDDVCSFLDLAVKDIRSRIPPDCQGLMVLPEDPILCEQPYWIFSEYQLDGGELGSHSRGATEMMPRRVGRILWLWRTLVSMRWGMFE